MLRFALAIMLAGLLFATSTVLHILSATYLAGLLSGLLLGSVLWMRWRQKPAPGIAGRSSPDG